MSGNTNDRPPVNAQQPMEAYVPVALANDQAPPSQDIESLMEWFSSDEFEARLTRCFGEAKKKAIEERDRVLAEYQSKTAAKE